MDKRVEQLGYDVVENRPGDGDCFYASAARAFRIETQGLKNVIYDFLKSHQFDVSIQPIANSRTVKINLLCQFAAILTRIFGQSSQLLQIITVQNGIDYPTRLLRFVIFVHLPFSVGSLDLYYASLVFMKGTSCRVVGRK